MFVSAVMQSSNLDLKNIVTTIRPDQLEQLLNKAQYNKEKNRYSVEGFKNGFSLEYSGSTEVHLI